MRISSEVFPFASHKTYGYSLDYAAAELKVRICALTSSYSNLLASHRLQATSRTSWDIE